MLLLSKLSQHYRNTCEFVKLFIYGITYIVCELAAILSRGGGGGGGVLKLVMRQGAVSMET